MAMSESNNDIVSKIESLNIDREDNDAVLVEVDSDYFPVSSSVHRFLTQDGQTVQAIRSKWVTFLIISKFCTKEGK